MTQLIASPEPYTETILRQRLAIPTDARQVLIFAESSHWDPNWLRTSEEYFQLIEPGLIQAVHELRVDVRRVYSIECIFFLRMFWETHPELRSELRDLLNGYRLRLTGSGVTTPDTLLPSEEAILRDMLIGQEWLRAQGISQEPRLAYFPDCFGHSPNLPALLNAAGFDRSAVTRIDGMWFMSADLDLPGNFPLKGSSAEQLLKRERCLDFTWRAADGSEVLCHWNAFTYGQGDMLAYSGQARIYLYPKLCRPDRSEKNVNQRISEYLHQLAPLSRTPYLFCPIGWDFNPPIPALNELLDRYNRTVYPTSGVWLLNAGLDDYFDLIESYREKLPVLQMDPNPYWTGFYTARPALKQRAFRLVERLTLCEQLGMLSHEPARVGHYLEHPWWAAAVANHHDFITGTAPDRVAYGEQFPMLDEALHETRVELEQLEESLHLPVPEPASPATALPECIQEGNNLHILTNHFDLTLSADSGGQIARLVDVASGSALFRGPAHNLVQYNESGGLWRMGYEYRGGSFRDARLPLSHAHFEVQEQGAYLRITWKTPLSGESLEQTLWVGRDDPLLYVQMEGRAQERSTLTLGYPVPFKPGELRMEAPGGNITRPLSRVYAHPFWPVQRYLYLPDPSGGTGFALLLRFPGAAAVSAEGRVEVVTQRNATREKAYFNMFNLLGMPATGIERERTAFRCALAFPDPSTAHALPGQARGLQAAPWASPQERLAAQITKALVEVDSDQVFVTAFKPAWRGKGFILRLSAPGAPLSPVRVHFKHQHIQRACLCDARERNLRTLEVNGQDLIVPMERSVVTLRIG